MLRILDEVPSKARMRAVQKRRAGLVLECGLINPGVGRVGDAGRIGRAGLVGAITVIDDLRSGLRSDAALRWGNRVGVGHDDVLPAVTLQAERGRSLGLRHRRLPGTRAMRAVGPGRLMAPFALDAGQVPGGSTLRSRSYKSVAGDAAELGIGNRGDDIITGVLGWFGRRRVKVVACSVAACTTEVAVGIEFSREALAENRAQVRGSGVDHAAVSLPAAKDV